MYTSTRLYKYNLYHEIVSAAWLVGQFSWPDMIWNSAHLSTPGPTVDGARQSASQVLRKHPETSKTGLSSG